MIFFQELREDDFGWPYFDGVLGARDEEVDGQGALFDVLDVEVVDRVFEGELSAVVGLETVREVTVAGVVVVEVNGHEGLDCTRQDLFVP